MSTLNVDSLRSLSDGKATKFLDTSGLNQGVLVKVLCRWNGTGTASIGHSQGVSSLTDNGTGQFQITFSSGIKDANGTSVGSNIVCTISSDSPVNATAQPFHTVSFLGGLTNTTAVVDTFNLNNSTVRADPARLNLIVTG